MSVHVSVSDDEGKPLASWTTHEDGIHVPDVGDDNGVLLRMATEVYHWSVAKGWEPDESRTFGDELALIHSEVSEALEAYRDWKFADATAPASPGDIPKPEGVGSEFADILIRLLHYSITHGIDLFAEYRRKMDYNYTRAYRHGGRNL